ncbi:MAG: leucine-rich repeat protein [Coriobacteriia bacterium]|nr:leucine-rich repeat protein [Coriobacteriia bacterium]
MAAMNPTTTNLAAANPAVTHPIIKWAKAPFVILAVAAVSFALLLMPGAGERAHAAAVTGTCGTNMTFTYEDGVFTTKGTGVLEDSQFWEVDRDAVVNVNRVSTLIVGEGCTGISTAFEGSTTLKMVNLPDTLQSIGCNAFLGCSNVVIDLPNSVTSVDNNAFKGVSKVVVHSAKVATLVRNSGWCFERMVVRDYPNAFPQDAGECGQNLTYTLKDGTLTVSGTGDMYDYGSAADAPWNNIDFPTSAKESTRKVVIGKGCTRVGARAFEGFRGLDTIVFSNTVDSIGAYAFAGNRFSLEQVTFPSSLKTIGKRAFFGAEGLRKAKFPEGLTTVGAEAFLESGRLHAILPESLTAVGQNAFQSYNMYVSSWRVRNLVSLGGGFDAVGLKRMSSKDFIFSWKSRGYTGRSQHPTLTSRSKLFVAGKSYKLTYPKSTKVGRYYVTASYPYSLLPSHKVASYTIVPKTIKTRSLTPKRSARQMVASWTRVASQCDGYRVQISSTSKFAKSHTITKRYSAARSKVKFVGCKPGKTYYFRICAYKKAADGKTYYGKWSPVKKVRY